MCLNDEKLWHSQYWDQLEAVSKSHLVPNVAMAYWPSHGLKGNWPTLGGRVIEKASTGCETRLTLIRMGVCSFWICLNGIKITKVQKGNAS